MRRPNSPRRFHLCAADQRRRSGQRCPHTGDDDREAASAAAQRSVNRLYRLQKAAASASTDDFNNGKAAIGTGPYKLVPLCQGRSPRTGPQRCLVGRQTPWEKATLRILTNDRPASPLLCCQATSRRWKTRRRRTHGPLKNDKNLSLARVGSNRLILPAPSRFQAMSRHCHRQARQTVDQKSAQKDARVRKAISLALNRDAIVSRVMEGRPSPPANRCRMATRHV